MKPTLSLRSFLLGSSLPSAIAAFCLLNPSAQAANIWDGGGADDSTLTANNWDNNIVPTGGTGVLTFAGSVRPTVVWNGLNSVAPVNFYGIIFAAGASAFTINSGTQTSFQFTNTGNSSIILNSSSNLQTLKPIVYVFFNGTKTIDGSNSGLALDGGISFRADGLTSVQSNKLILTGTADSTTSSIGQLGAYASGATNSLTKTGSGKWTVTGNATYVGATTISAGTLEFRGSVSSSGITNNSALVFNNAGTQSYANAISGGGTLTKNGAGTITLSGTNSYGGATTVNDGILNFSRKASKASATVTAAAAGSVGLGVKTSDALYYSATDVGNLFNTNSLTGFSLNAASGVAIDTTNAGGSFDQTVALTAARALTKLGTGTLVLSQTNTYTGATTVAAGTLAVNGSLANTATTVQSGGTLQGSGTIGGSVTIQSVGTLAPGNSIESLGSGALIFQAGSTYAYELQTNLYVGSPNLSADLTFSTGTLDIVAGSFLTLTDLAASTALANGSKLTLISYFGGWTSEELFTYDGNTLADDSTFTLGANQWRFDYNDTTGGPNFTSDQTGATSFVTMTVVPEPGAALLGSLGLLALLRRRRS